MSNHAPDCAWQTSYQPCTCGHADRVKASIVAISNEWKQREADAITYLREWAKENENAKGWAKLWDAHVLADHIGVVLMGLDAEMKQ